MAAAPVPPTPGPTPMPTSEPVPLSQGARILNTFVAPSKTFADLRRSAAWWAPFLLMAIVSLLFGYVVSQKVGFPKVMENEMQSQPKAQERLERLPADQREKQMEVGAKVTAGITYAFPVIQLVLLLIIAGVLMATFKVGAGADVSYPVSLAIVVYASLPGIGRGLLAIVALLAGASPDAFSIKNPLPTNPAYFMTAADSPFLYSLASALDIFFIWTLVLTAIGFTCVSKVKRSTALWIVFGWYVVFNLAAAGLGTLFS